MANGQPKYPVYVSFTIIIQFVKAKRRVHPNFIDQTVYLSPASYKITLIQLSVFDAVVTVRTENELSM